MGVTEDATEEVTVEEDEATEDVEETKNSESLAAPDPEKCFQSDEDYFRALSDKELKWLWKNTKSYDRLDEGTWKCTACFKQINHKDRTAVLRHPTLGVAICRNCRDFYYNGDWTK